MRVGAVLRLCSRPELRYQQGQRPEPGIREYFYYVDHQGQLFLDDTKVKNFVTCFKDVGFLSSFSRSQERFPFLSRFSSAFLSAPKFPSNHQKTLQKNSKKKPQKTSRKTPKTTTRTPKNPPKNPKKSAAGLVRWALAQELSAHFRFHNGPQEPPTHLVWRGKEHRLCGEILGMLRAHRSGSEAGAAMAAP
ncbi:UPF0598 protein C8orf82 homolog [Geospiza fortis]|uniref:UPF0598 protein C8orf82 homolog n=1 Tax=Geospiza fortis TaxID=48883 RepID=A0A8N5HY85_GEOFO|nr:UPF0598 protein C8orf82 homolog [Geospiza fortis]